MATTTGKPVEEVKKVLQSLPSVEIDEQGRVVGLGLTPYPYPSPLYGWWEATICLVRPWHTYISSTHRSFGQHRVTLSQHRRTYTVECGTGPHCKRGTFHCRCLNRDARWYVLDSYGILQRSPFLQLTECSRRLAWPTSRGKVLSVEDAFELGRLMGTRYEESRPANGSCCDI